MLTEKTMEKLRVLAESAKYDVSCSSSGTVRKGKQGMVGSTVGGVGICHSFADDGRCISLLKVMLTNYCMYDCAYCINRRSMTSSGRRSPSANWKKSRWSSIVGTISRACSCRVG